MTRAVVVGLDGSPASLVAAEHGAHAAARRGLPLHLVHGYLHPFGYGVAIDPYALGLPEPSEEAEQAMNQVAERLRARWPELTVRVRQVAGGPAITLITESNQAELVVVGSRGRGGFAGLLLGSVSTQVAEHAHCPVLVIRPDDQPSDTAGPVIVGVDGAPANAPALHFAADEAALRASPLVVIHVLAPGSGQSFGADDVGSDGSGRAMAERLMTDAVAEARRGQPELAVEQRLIQHRKPDQALLDASHGAAMVVVGSGGPGGLNGKLLGSVSQTLLHHAHCPVLVAHPHGHRH